MPIDDNVNVTWVNGTDITDDEILDAIESGAGGDNVGALELATLGRWVKNNQRRQGGVFQRDVYVTPHRIFDQFETAQFAVENDDIVGNAADITESLMLNKVIIDSPDEQEADVWNQILKNMRTVQGYKQIVRDLFTTSNCYVGIWWGRKDYKVGKKTEKGNKSKKEFKNMQVPLRITTFDAKKIVPVGSFMFGQERLVYIAEQYEYEQILKGLYGEGDDADPIAQAMYEGPYKFDDYAQEARIKEITGCGSLDHCLLLRKDRVFRITDTRADYDMFASVRMKGIFELLDLKRQLREMDRTMLLGATQYILLVRKGSEKLPAEPQELERLQSQVSRVASVPIIVGDHRLQIDIITPPTDNTLDPTKYDLLDSRIAAKVYQIMHIQFSGGSGNKDDTVKLLKLVAKGLEARRNNIDMEIFLNIIEPTYEKNDKFTEIPTLTHWPRKVALDFDPNMANFIQDCADRGWISRESVLAEIGLIEEDEAMKREAEKKWDDLFLPPQIPFTDNKGPTTSNPGGSADTNSTPGNNRTAGKSKGGQNRRSGTSTPNNE